MKKYIKIKFMLNIFDFFLILSLFLAIFLFFKHKIRLKSSFFKIYCHNFYQSCRHIFAASLLKNEINPTIYKLKSEKCDILAINATFGLSFIGFEKKYAIIYAIHPKYYKFHE